MKNSTTNSLETYYWEDNKGNQGSFTEISDKVAVEKIHGDKGIVVLLKETKRSKLAMFLHLQDRPTYEVVWRKQ